MVGNRHIRGDKKYASYDAVAGKESMIILQEAKQKGCGICSPTRARIKVLSVDTIDILAKMVLEHSENNIK